MSATISEASWAWYCAECGAGGEASENYGWVEESAREHDEGNHR